MFACALVWTRACVLLLSTHMHCVCARREYVFVCSCCAAVQVSDSSTQRLPEFVFRVSAVELQATRGASLSHNTLRIKLQQITTLQAPGAVLSLGEFEWTEPLLEVRTNV